VWCRLASSDAHKGGKQAGAAAHNACACACAHRPPHLPQTPPLAQPSPQHPSKGAREAKQQRGADACAGMSRVISILLQSLDPPMIETLRCCMAPCASSSQPAGPAGAAFKHTRATQGTAILAAAAGGPNVQSPNSQSWLSICTCPTRCHLHVPLQVQDTHSGSGNSHLWTVLVSRERRLRGACQAAQ
jgi:hypothetical protein